jgi:hypothetical protein
MHYHQNKRALAITKSIQWYQDLHPSSKVLSNYFDIDWYTSNIGVTLHLIQILDDSHLPAAFRNELAHDVEEFKKFFRIFSFVVASSTKFYCPINQPFKARKWTPTKVLKKMNVDFTYLDGHGTDMTNFSANSRGRRQQTDWITLLEAGDERTRALLNQLFD